MIITWTGHRPDKLNHEWDGIGPWSDAIRLYMVQQIVKHNVKMFVSGLALGTDLLAAEVAIEHNLKLIAAAPCDNHTKGWNPVNLARIERIKGHSRCRYINVCPGPYEKWKMQARNIWMVNKGNGVSGIFDGSRGGTANCLEYAMQQLKKGRLNFVEQVDPRKLIAL